MQDLDLDKHTSWVFFAFSGGPHRWSSSANKFFLYKHERFGGFAKKKIAPNPDFLFPPFSTPKISDHTITCLEYEDKVSKQTRMYSSGGGKKLN